MCQRLPFFVFALLLTSCAGPQQTTGLNDDGAPSRATVVTVTPENPDADAAYRALANELQERGYLLDNTDATLRSISTEWHTPPETKGRLEVRLAGSVLENGRVRLRGWYKVPILMPQERPIEKYGQDGSVTRRAWVHLHEVAEALGSDPTYD